MALLGSSIDPRLQLQDYSGIVNAAQMQAQGLASIGSQIEAAAQQYKQYKKEQADTQKRVKAAANLADSISALVPELKGPLGATVAQLKDPNLTLSDKDALAQSISNTLQLGIGVVSGNKERALRQEEIGLKREMIAAETQAERDLRAAKVKEEEEKLKRANIGDLQYAKSAIEVIPNTTPRAKKLISDLIGLGQGTAAKQAIDAIKDFAPEGSQNDVDRNEQGQLILINRNTGEATPVWSNPATYMDTPESGIQGAAGMPVGQPPSAAGISGALYTPGAGVAAPVYQPERDMPGGTILPTISPYYETIQEDLMSAMGMPQAPARQVSPEQVRAAANVPSKLPTETGPVIQVPPGRQPVMAKKSAAEIAAETTARLNELKIKEAERKEVERLKAEEAKKEVTASDAERYLANLGDYWTKLNESIVQDSGVIGANVRAFTQGIRGSEMNKLLAMKDTLDAEALVSAITKLRATSPTGATGLGSITDPERRNLIALVGNIDPVNIDIAKANTERLLEKVADLAYGTKPELDQLLKEGKINRSGYDESLKFRQMALRGEIGKLIGARIREEREGPLPTNTFTPGVDDETEQLLKGRGF